jgi:ABC-2 type transport system permease protein
VVSVVLAVVVSFALRFLYNLPAFWLLDIRGVVLLVVSVNLFFSGAIVPVAYFPGWLKTVADALPFAAILQTPVDVWLGKAHVWLIGLQVVWAAVLFALGRLVLARATRKLVVQGG